MSQSNTTVRANAELPTTTSLSGIVATIGGSSTFQSSMQAVSTAAASTTTTNPRAVGTDNLPTTGSSGSSEARQLVQRTTPTASANGIDVA
eukprot:3189198-Amphidinium_carterae.1